MKNSNCLKKSIDEISELAILDVIKSHKREDQFELSKVKAPKYLGSDNKYHYILYSYNNDLLLASSNLMVGFAYRRYLEHIYTMHYIMYFAIILKITYLK